MRSANLPTLVALLPIAFFLGCGNSASNPKACTALSTPNYAYVLNDGDNTISMYSVNSCTGALIPNTPASISTGANAFGSETMVVDPAGRFVYVANLGSNAVDLGTISMFTIDASTGLLTPTTPAMVSTGFLPQGIGIDPLGRFVYTANSDDNTVSMFTINATTGVLTPTTPPTVAAGWSPLAVSVDPSGKFAYAGNGDDGTISMYTINQNTGVLTPTTPASVSADGSPFAIAFDPSGKFAYAPDGFGNLIAQYTIDQTTGVLAINTIPAVAAGQSPTDITVDPSGKFAYVVNRSDNSISAFTINSSTGSLGALGTIATGTQPFRVAIDPTDKFVYTTNESGSVSTYTINTDGSLQEGTTSVLPGAPVAVVLAAPKQ